MLKIIFKLFFLLVFLIQIQNTISSEKSKDERQNEAKDAIHIKDIDLTDGCNASPYVSGCRASFGKRLNNLNEDKVQAVQVAPISPQPVVAPVVPVPNIGSNDNSLQKNDINPEEKLSPSERLQQRRKKREERDLVTDGCNPSPYSSSCTNGPSNNASIIPMHISEEAKKRMAEENKCFNPFRILSKKERKKIKNIDDFKEKFVKKKRELGKTAQGRKILDFDKYCREKYSPAPIASQPEPQESPLK